MRRFIPLLLATLPAFASTVTTAEIDGFGTTTISGNATASYFGDTGLDPGSISASTSATAFTLGPVRDGFIEITGSGGGEFGNGNVTIGGYSFACSAASCSPAGYINGAALPFTLGVPFQVDISASASLFDNGSDNVSFRFSVFESVELGFPFAPFPGASVTVTDPPEVPEPATILLSSGGLALLAVARRIRRK